MATRTLSVSVDTLSQDARPGVQVQAWMVAPNGGGLAFTDRTGGMPTYSDPVAAITGSTGVASLRLIPSNEAPEGYTYTVAINARGGPYVAERLTMPDRNATLRELIAAVHGDRVTSPTLLFGTGESNTPAASALTVRGVNGDIAVAPYVGERFQYIARLASEPDIVSVILSDDSTALNQITAYEKFRTQVQVGDMRYNVWVSTHAISNVSALTIMVE